MTRFTSRKAIAAIVVGVAVAGTGTAIAAGGSGSGNSFLDSVAKHLGISTEKLRDATKAAATDQVDAQLKAGAITQEQADALKKRIESGPGPSPGGFGGRGHHGVGGPGGPGFGGPGGHLADAATYLGLTEAKLVELLQAGKTLAEVAKAQDKTVDGLEAALLASEKKELDALVESGEITQAQADSALADRRDRLGDMVNGTFGGGAESHGFGGRMRGHDGGFGRGGPLMPGAPGLGSGSSFGPAMQGGASLGTPA